MPALTSLALGLGGLGAIAGGISGAQGSTQSTTKNIAPAGAMEQQLQQDSLNNYNQQQGLVDQQQSQLPQAQQFQGQAQGVLGNVLNGSQFNITPQQQAQIDSIRNASIQAGQGDIQNFVNQNLGQVQSDAANRGLRGQALSELQGRTVNEGTRLYSNLVGQANQTAAQQSLDSPYRQAALQANTAQNNMSYADQLRQQAINNRNTLQNPALMNSLTQQREAAAGTTQTTPGNFGSAAGGVLAGIGSGLGAGGGLAKAFGSGGVGSSVGSPGVGSGGTSDFNGSNGLGNYNFAHGGVVPGGMPNFRGDHIANDTTIIHATPGEGVIPLSHMKSPDLAIAYIKHMHKTNMVPNWRA